MKSCNEIMSHCAAERSVWKQMSQSLSFVEAYGLFWSRLHLEEKQQESTTAFQAGYAYTQLFLRNIRSCSTKLHMVFCNSYVNTKVNLQQKTGR